MSIVVPKLVILPEPVGWFEYSIKSTACIREFKSEVQL
ncbi:hypothetical protein HC248_03289 [Polaromonas vacuolata]|uniref:Uncharacterized protein n=1 Tax=Polaromonas vacuolata TaxID=37448 RepID=A0A6H2HDW9_9BURK|nr:hypothetical protein HC248_03289 [Polaromonas vacuolata]